MEKENHTNELVHREPLEGTPFQLIGTENKWFITLGKYRLCEPTQTRQQALEYLETNYWHITMQLIMIVVDENDALKELKKTNPIKSIYTKTK